MGDRPAKPRSDRPVKPHSAAVVAGGSVALDSQIADKLKALYTAVEQEPIPDIFLDLLERLDRAERGGTD